MHSELLYSNRRLLPGDLKILYVGPGLGASGYFEGLERNPFDFETSSESEEVNIIKDEVKGGVKLTDYLTFNCLENQGDELSSVMNKNWTCKFCDTEFYVGPLERLVHFSQCLDKEEDLKSE